MMKKFAVGLIILISIVGSSPAFATPIKYIFSGTVTQMIGFDELPGSVGDTFTGYLTYVIDPDLELDYVGNYPFLGSYYFNLNGYEIRRGEFSMYLAINEAHDPDPSYLNMYDETPSCGPAGNDVVDGFRISMNIPFSTGSVYAEHGDGAGSFGMRG